MTPVESPLCRFDVAAHETLTFAPYATFSSQSQGRQHREQEHSYRGCYQRDRDRIVHSAAYRRLSGKMQVFTGDMGDYHRTRLTHTLEVASISRTIGRCLRLNEDLIEALAYFHDIGHPPYGHAGEDILHECLINHGGFSHNGYALTLATELELRYTAYPGLNLTHEVLESQRFRVDKDSDVTHPLLEAQVVEAADSITYNAHDTDDAIKLGLVTLPQLAEVPLVAEALNSVRERHAGIEGDQLRMAVVHELLDRQVGDTIRNASEHLGKANYGSAAEATQAAYRIEVSGEMREKKRELEVFLYERIYRHPRLIAIRNTGQDKLRDLFAFYSQNPEQMPKRHSVRVPRVGLERSVGDYLAGMTERYFEQQHDRWIKSYTRN